MPCEFSGTEPEGGSRELEVRSGWCLQPGQKRAAAFLETRRFGAMLGGALRAFGTHR